MLNIIYKNNTIKKYKIYITFVEESSNEIELMGDPHIFYYNIEKSYPSAQDLYENINWFYKSYNNIIIIVYIMCVPVSTGSYTYSDTDSIKHK